MKKASNPPPPKGIIKPTPPPAPPRPYKNNTHSNLNKITVNLFPGTIEWLKRQDNPDGVVQAALIEYRQRKAKNEK